MGRRVQALVEQPARAQSLAYRCGAAHDRGDQRIRLLELQRDRGVVDLVETARLAVDRKLRKRSRHEVLVAVDVLVPEHEIVGGKGLAIRPFVSLAQVQHQRSVAVGQLPGFGHGRDLLGAGVVPEQDLVHRHPAVTVLVVGGASEGAMQRATIFADLAQRFDDQRLFGHALLDGRELALLHELRKHRRFGELGRSVPALRGWAGGVGGLTAGVWLAGTAAPWDRGNWLSFHAVMATWLLAGLTSLVWKPRPRVRWVPTVGTQPGAMRRESRQQATRNDQRRPADSSGRDSTQSAATKNPPQSPSDDSLRSTSLGQLSAAHATPGRPAVSM